MQKGEHQRQRWEGHLQSLAGGTECAKQLLADGGEAPAQAERRVWGARASWRRHSSRADRGSR